jgi:phosphoserine phosphatase
MTGLPMLTGDALRVELVRYIPLRSEYSKSVYVVIDADRTLAPEDTGRLVGRALGIDDAISRIFAEFDYIDEAFTAVSALWSSVGKADYERGLESVAASIRIRSSWTEILNAVVGHVPVMVVTAGIPQVWRRALSNAGHAQLPVLGGCHCELDNYVVSAQTKAEIVKELRACGWVVVAAGDSRVDLPMLAAANVALFVPDQKGSPALRTELVGMSTIRHLVVDEQRFDGLQACTATDVAKMILRGGNWNAD